jgi:trans-aconitate methyltransferase
MNALTRQSHAGRSNIETSSAEISSVEISSAEKSSVEISSAESPPWLARFQPQKPMAALVEELNSIFHSYDAENYAKEHPEIYDFLPGLWQEMISFLPPRDRWRILDFGCGAGFEARQLLAGLGGKVEALACYDPSVEMLAQCKRQLGDMGVDTGVATFSSSFRQAVERGPFHLLVTNSVLHHLPRIPATIASILPHLSGDAWWIAGHEPSSRFYRNESCTRLLGEYEAYRKWKRWFDPAAYVAKMRMPTLRHPLRLTAKAAVARGLFKKTPSPLVVDRMVDFHVAHSVAEAAAGRGLDFESMGEEMAAQWKLRRVKTYFFLGPYAPHLLPRRWAERGSQLAALYPNDGANFCAVWARV